MSIAIMALVWKHAPFRGDKLLLFLALADHANDEGYCWPSIKALAEKTRCSETTVHTTIKELARRGFLSVEQNTGPKRVNLYVIMLSKLYPAKTAPCENSTLQSQVPLGVQSPIGEGEGAIHVGRESSSPPLPSESSLREEPPRGLGGAGGEPLPRTPVEDQASDKSGQLKTKRKSPKTEASPELISTMVQKFGLKLSEQTVCEQVALAWANTSRLKYPGHEDLYVANWLRREVANKAHNGTGPPVPQLTDADFKALAAGTYVPRKGKT